MDFGVSSNSSKLGAGAVSKRRARSVALHATAAETQSMEPTPRRAGARRVLHAERTTSSRRRRATRPGEAESSYFAPATQVPEQTASMPEELHTPSSVVQCSSAPQDCDDMQTVAVFFSQPL